MELSSPKKYCRDIVENSASSLCLAKSFLKDGERKDAFSVMYAVMRIADDLVDERKINGRPAGEEEIKKELLKWEKIVDSAYSKTSSHPVGEALEKALQKFPLPKKLWADFFNSMKKDLEGKDFSSFSDFEDYCIGATCSPTTIYLYLTMSKKNGSAYIIDDFDYIEAGKALGIWAYMVHIMRDAAKDTENSLFYFPAEDFRKFGLERKDLEEFLRKKKIDKRYEKFSEFYLEKAGKFYEKGINELLPALEKRPPDQKFAVLSVIKTYKKLEEKLKEKKGDVFSEEISGKKEMKEICFSLKQELNL